MAQINLLKQSVPEKNLWTILPNIFAKVLLVLLVLLAAYYGWKVLESKNIAKSIRALELKISEEKREGLTLPKRDEVLVRQQQLQALNQVVENHLYWTQIFPELARVTFNKAHYSSIKIGADGILNMTGTVPTINDLDKFLQVFDLPAFNKHFSDIRIGGYNKIQGQDNNSTVDFDVMMKFNPELIKYKGSDKQ